MAGKIFINYRRGDDPGFAQALFGRLEQAFPAEQLFIDVDNIEPGLDFVRVLTDQVTECDVLISVIGKGWIDARDDAGVRRLDNPADFVRVEIESALAQDKRVIPVLVGQAQMPRADQLPEAMKPFATRNAVRLTHERFRSDTGALIAALQRALKIAEDARNTQAKAKRLDGEAAANRSAHEEARRSASEGRATAARSTARRKSSVDAGGRSAKNCFALNYACCVGQLSCSALISSHLQRSGWPKGLGRDSRRGATQLQV
jgi:TIR domain